MINTLQFLAMSENSQNVLPQNHVNHYKWQSVSAMEDNVGFFIKSQYLTLDSSCCHFQSSFLKKGDGGEKKPQNTVISRFLIYLRGEKK